LGFGRISPHEVSQDTAPAILLTNGDIMMIKARKIAIAIAIVGPLSLVAAGESFAGPMNTLGVKAAVPAAATEVRYRQHYTYTYPAYSYWGYPTNTYWGYPSYAWGYPGYSWGYPGYYGYTYGW
jgi:hypothetical protein